MNKFSETTVKTYTFETPKGDSLELEIRITNFGEGTYNNEDSWCDTEVELLSAMEWDTNIQEWFVIDENRVFELIDSINPEDIEKHEQL